MHQSVTTIKAIIASFNSNQVFGTSLQCTVKAVNSFNPVVSCLLSMSSELLASPI